MRVVVVGAGPAGLTTLKTLLHAPSSLGTNFDPVILELGDSIGGTFDQRSYENGTLVSSKQLTCFSDREYFHLILHLQIRSTSCQLEPKLICLQIYLLFILLSRSFS